MDLEALEKIGLTKGESRVYLSLLNLGGSSVGRIVNESGIARSKIYDVLDRLMTKGLVSFVVEGKIKQYNAVPPKRFHEFLETEREEIDSKEKELQKLLPLMNALVTEKQRTYAEILQGPRGLKAFFDMSLYDNNKKEEVLVLGYSKDASIYFHAYWRDYHKERIRRKISGKVIYDYGTWKLKDRDKRKYVEQRYLPKGITTPAFVYIWGNVVGTVIFTKEQKLCFMIKNKSVAKSYKDYFNLLWKQAVKTGK